MVKGNKCDLGTEGGNGWLSVARLDVEQRRGVESDGVVAGCRVERRVGRRQRIGADGRRERVVKRVVETEREVVC